MSLETAQRRLLALGYPLEMEFVGVADAAGRWLAEDVHALRSQPSADLSAMDGYAISYADLPGPWVLVGNSAAGDGFDEELAPGESVRIFTGAPLPPPSDTVLMQEIVRQDGEMIHLAGDPPPRAGHHVRHLGSDFLLDDLVGEEGQRLDPGRLALLVMAGHGTVAVRRRPRVALLSTGNELVPPGQPVPHHHIPASNAPMLEAMLAPLGAEIVNLGIVRDDLESLTQLFAGLSGFDLLITTGGASVGDHDLVRPALVAAGARLDFWKAAIKPGKPLMAGRLGDAVVLGLPGNPVSSFVTAQLFALPLVRQLAGARDPLPRPIRARLAEYLPATGSRAEFIRASFDGADVYPLAGQDSAALAALAGANALIRRTAHAPLAQAGDTVELLLIA